MKKKCLFLKNLIFSFIFLSVPLFLGTAFDLKIETAQFLAVLNNDEIKIARMNQRLMQRNYGLGFTKFLPQVATSYSFSNMILYSLPSDSISVYTVPYMQSVTLSVNQMVFDGGKLFSNTYFKYYELSLLKRELSEREEKIYTDMEALYSEVYFLGKKVEQQRQNVEVLRKEEEIVRRKTEMGVVTQIEYKEFLLQLNEAELNLIQQRRGYDFMLEELKDIIGLDEGIGINLVSELVVMDYTIDEALIEEFSKLTNKQNSKSNSMKINFYKSKIKQIMTYISFAPTVDLNFSYQWEGDEWPLYRKGWTLGFSVVWDLPGFPVKVSGNAEFPTSNEDNLSKIDTTTEMLGNVQSKADIKLFQNLEAFNKFEQANIELFKAKNEYERYVKNTRRQIKKLIKEYNELIELLFINREREKLIEEKLSIEKVKYEQGSLRHIDIVKSEMALYATRLTILDTSNKIYKSIISIKTLTGISTEEFYAIIK